MKFLSTARRTRPGFTLLELLVVMVILVMLAGVVTMVVTKRVEEANHAKAVTDIKMLVGSLDTYYLHNKEYPAEDDGGLTALREKPQGKDNWNGPYVKKDVPLDPWGNAYVYKCPGDENPDSYDLYSLGKDGKEGGEGADADIKE